MRKMKILLTMSLLAASASAQTVTSKVEGGVLFSGTFLREIGSSDAGIGTSAVGIGGRFVYRALPHVDFESDIILWPNNQATSGTWVESLSGVKAGQRFDKFGLFAKVRPGFMYFRKDPFGATKTSSASASPLNTRWATSLEPALDLGGVIEYYTEKNLIVRFDLGDTLLHYGRRNVFQSQGQPSQERGGFTTNNWQGSLGIGFRF
jgi:hypothetical protein